MERQARSLAKKLEEMHEEKELSNGKLAGEQKEPALRKVKGGHVQEKTARAREALEQTRLQDGVQGAKVEEYILETRDVAGTARALKELLAEYDRGKSADRQAITGRKANAKEDSTEVLLVQVDARAYRELVEKLSAFRGPSGMKDSPEPAGHQARRTRRNWHAREARRQMASGRGGTAGRVQAGKRPRSPKRIGGPRRLRLRCPRSV
jgi:hypothetical protein